MSYVSPFKQGRRRCPFIHIRQITLQVKAANTTSGGVVNGPFAFCISGSSSLSYLRSPFRKNDIEHSTVHFLWCSGEKRCSYLKAILRRTDQAVVAPTTHDLQHFFLTINPVGTISRIDHFTSNGVLNSINHSWVRSGPRRVGIVTFPGAKGIVVWV